MTFLHFGIVSLLAYAPYFIAYKYSSLSEYSLWKCGQAVLVYLLTQFVKMMALATFFPASEVDPQSFNIASELAKNSVDVIDLLGMHLAITYFISGRGEVRFLTVGLSWAAAHSVASSFISVFIGARNAGFHWKYLQTALNCNVDLIFYISVAALIWLFNRNDVAPMAKRLVGALLIFAILRNGLYQALQFHFLISSWGMIGAKAGSTSVLAALSLCSYATTGPAYQHPKGN